MKKTLVALAALAATASFAQSSVTLYGVADVWVGSLKSGSVSVAASQTGTNTPLLTTTSNSAVSQLKLDSGGQSGSRWGLRGSEDLGGGLKANFVFESGLNVDTGSAAQGGLAFGRQAFVGLGGEFGEVRFGRQYSAYDAFKGNVTAQGNNGFDVTNGTAVNGADATTLSTTLAQTATLGQAQTLATSAQTVLNKLAGQLGTWVGYNARIDNALSYTSPNFSGVTGQVVIGLGENKSSSVSATRNASFHVNYANGPLAVGMAYQNDQLAKSTAGTVALNNTVIGGSYDLGTAKIFASFNSAQYKIPGVSTEKATELGLGVRVPMGPATLVAQYARSKFKDGDANTGFSVEGLYALSKRTDTYVGITSSKLARISDDLKNNLFAVGVRHRF